MERIDLYQLYEIGSQLHPFSELPEDVPVGNIFLPLMNAIAAVQRLLGPESRARLDFRRQDAEKLRDELVSLQSILFRNADGAWSFPKDRNQRVDSWRMFAPKAALNAFEAVFRTEMQRAATYLVPKRGTYNLGDLVDRANETFTSEIRAVIGPMANEEYINAGRCFAFGLFTASGYHCCRSVEFVLREYFRSFTGITDTGKESWGQIIDQLEKCSAVIKPDEKTLSHIRHIKDYDRNPLSHVRIVLGATDADMLLASSKVAITAMASELTQKSLASAPVLALESDNAGS